MSRRSEPEPYAVTFAPTAARQLRRLRADDAVRLRRPILALAFDPRPPGARMLVGTRYLRIRIGEQRVVYIVDDQARRVVVVRVARRAESTYRRL